MSVRRDRHLKRDGSYQRGLRLRMPGNNCCCGHKIPYCTALQSADAPDPVDQVLLVPIITDDRPLGVWRCLNPGHILLTCRRKRLCGIAVNAFHGLVPLLSSYSTDKSPVVQEFRSPQAKESAEREPHSWWQLAKGPNRQITPVDFDNQTANLQLRTCFRG